MQENMNKNVKYAWKWTAENSVVNKLYLIFNLINYWVVLTVFIIVKHNQIMF